MPADQHRLEDDGCPIGDALFAEVCSVGKPDLPALMATIAPEIRAMLALFCYRRSHLSAIGLTIAASCDEYDLVQSGGRAGAVLFARSREAPQPMPAASHYTSRRKITLATGPFGGLPVFQDEPDDDFSEAAYPVPA